MWAAVYRKTNLVVAQIPDPVPGPGQVLVKTLSCGICGSDLHTFQSAVGAVAMARRTGSPFDFDPERDVVFGHEFCAEVLDYGPDTNRTIKSGTRVSAMPVGFAGNRLHAIGYSNDLPGGFGERMVLTESLLVEVPNGLSSDHAVVAEPMAVGWHAVREAGLTKDEVPLVLGCGPVGIAVIAGLKILGIHPIVAADFSPLRRKLAESFGADVVVDPAEVSPFKRWDEMALPNGRLLPASGFEAFYTNYASRRPCVVFECVGAPGVIQQILEGAPGNTRVIVVGVCLTPDRIEPAFAVNKNLTLKFVLGYTPEEFRQSLHHVANGMIDVSSMVTGHVGLGGVLQAFQDLQNPMRHAKIVVQPWRKGWYEKALALYRG
jgi:threonine dehydrogenase-like Zn-dependent dehydrogenase